MENEFIAKDSPVEEEKKTFESALGGLGLRYWEYDIQKKRLYRSQLVQNEVGYSAIKENVPESYVEEGIIHPDYAQAYLDFYHNLQRGKDGRLVFQSKYANGKWGWLDIAYKVLFDESHRPYKAIGVGGDITKQKEAERQLQQTQKTLRKVELLLSTAATIEYDYLTFIDGNTMEYISYSSEFENYIKTGDDYLEFIQKSKITPQSYWNRILREINQYGKYTRQVPILDASGKLRRKMYNYYYIDKEKMYIMGTGRDITEEFKKEECHKIQLQEAVKKAEEANEAKTVFLSQMSHEIRTPMNAIIGMLGLAKDTQMSQETLEYLKKIELSSDYLLGILNDILDMSRIESGKFELHPEWVPANDMIVSCMDMLSSEAKRKEIRFVSVEPDTDQGLELYVDSLRMRQILMNLINNAIKFTPVGGTVEISLNKKIIDEHQRIDEVTIRDTGCGMSKEFMKRIFKPFEQEQNIYSGSVQGTGLGLALVKQILTEMGGTISVDSELGKGSVFCYKLPLQYRVLESSCRQKKKITLEDLKEKRILVVDDHPLNREIVEKLLEKKEMFVEVAVNGADAIHVVENSGTNYYDAVLMDIRMPIMDGLEATRYIRKIDREDLKKLPIIAMTANAFDEDVEKSINAGMNAHLVKPINPNQLYEALAKYII